MNRPMIVILSQDQELTAELPSLFQGKVDVRSCDSVEELLDITRFLEPQGLVADFRRFSGSGQQELQILQTLHERFPRLPVALVTPDPRPALFDSPLGWSKVTKIHGVIDRNELVEAFHPILHSEEPDFQELIGTKFEDRPPLGTLNGISRRYETNSPEMQQMLLDLEVAARHDVTILLIGETGAGKTYLARLIHEVSLRRNEPFLPVACGALPADLIESELFGHVKGSFTSAVADKEGKFIAARRGSILLDEIDALGLEQQVKLLRVIETGEFEPVGSNQVQFCQARLIVASNLELQPLVEQGRFRPDLYYRLNMLKFVIPPLRHRKVDIVPLARKFIRQFSIKHQVRIDHVDSSLFQALLSYPWPGNVRELEHVIQRAAIYCRDGHLTAQQLPTHILSGTAGPANDPTVVLGGMNAPAAPKMNHSLGGQIALTEREIIEQALFKNSYSRTKTAKALGISRVTLYNKMKRYGLSPK